jgi:hypothetical protein
MIRLCRAGLNTPKETQYIDYLPITPTPQEYIKNNIQEFTSLFYLKTPDLL